MDIKLELIGVPVTDIDRAKAFYEQVGFHADHDVTVSEDIRFVQLTPPGSACSIALGKGITAMAPGSLDNMQVVVTDIEEAHADLTARGIEVSDISDQPWGSFVHFQDPDGNRWAVQQTTPRGAA
ncbi:VOC family protein [Streptomyces sp. NPDC015661]|uniref:VOC family protein n=1 Tax=Streptomyces sp. NPDC015661 TaxID=3364961 RepID=UPI0036FADBFE